MNEREPLAIRAAIVAFVAAAINVAVAFGVDLTADQVATLTTLVGVASALVIVVWTRGAVTPVADPRAEDGTALVPADEEESW